MCFSNLPIEFDDDGDPHLVAPDKEDEATHQHESDVATRATNDDGLDPETRYREILDTLPDRARDRLDSSSNQHHETPQSPTE